MKKLALMIMLITPLIVWGYDKDKLTIDIVKPFFKRDGSSLVILPGGVPNTIYMLKRYPVLIGKASTATNLNTQQSNMIEVKTIIITNERVVSGIDSSLFKTHRKKENNSRLTVNVVGGLAMAAGGFIWGVGIAKDLKRVKYTGGILTGAGGLTMLGGNIGISFKYKISFAKISRK